MTTQSQHVDDKTLQELVFGEEESQSWVTAAAHVETCDHCLERLKTISDAGAEFEKEAVTLLSDCPDETADEAIAGPRVEADSFQFFSPPRHPEMLGRLGRYDIERQIGAGGMGVVLKGFDTELNRPVAIKILARHLAHSGAARQRFAREAKAAAAVVHEHVVAIHNVETDDEFPFLVMQFVPGESLQTRVDREGPLDSKQILRIGIQAAAGLAAAHEQGVIHRDVKPANILLESSVERILLTDFGLARTVDDASLTHTGIVTGTPHYMSPEQAGGESSDQRTDLFSLGSVLYFMATGHPPFRAERAMGVLHRICTDRHRPVWEENPDISDELSDVIDDLLQKKPSRRIQTAAELRNILAKLLENIQQPRAWWLRRLKRVAREPKKLLSVGCCVAAVSAAVMYGWPSATVDDALNSAEHPNAIAGFSQPQKTVATDADGESAQRTSIDSVGGDTQSDVLIEAERIRMFSNAAAGLDKLSAEARQQITDLEMETFGRFVNPKSGDWSGQIEELNRRLDAIETSELQPPALTGGVGFIQSGASAGPADQ